jgi:hypothetical protein
VPLVFILIKKHNLVHRPVDFTLLLNLCKIQKKERFPQCLYFIFSGCCVSFVGGGSSNWKDAGGDTPDYLTVQVVGDELHFHFLVGTQLI